MQLPRIGPYELLVRLASGGAANVFLVRDTSADPPGRLLALKVLLPSLAQNEDFLKMFFTEAKIASQLNHGNVVAIAGFGQVDGVHCLAMEYVFGASLSQVLRASARAQKPLSVGVLLSVTAAVCDALHYAHEMQGEDGRPMGLVHRDVTPQNILIGFNGIPKLTDFGIAKATNRGWETQAGIVKGKFSYMSPEQALGKPVDRRSDIFGTGIVLWEALTGQDLFRGSTPMEVLKAIRDLKIQAPSKVVEGLTSVVDDIVLKALKRPVHKRYATAAAMGDEIRALIRKAGVTIDADSISREFAAIYGDVIEQRALALRAAMAGRVDTAELARVLGAHDLDARHLPRLDKALQNPDPLGLKHRNGPLSRADSRPVVLHESDVQSLDDEESSASFEEAPGWDDSTAMQVPDDDLLSMLSEDDATSGQVPSRFRARFRPGFASADSEPSFDEDEMTIGHVPKLEPRPLRAWGGSTSAAPPPSQYLRLDRPVPRAPSLDMEVESTLAQEGDSEDLSPPSPEPHDTSDLTDWEGPSGSKTPAVAQISNGVATADVGIPTPRAGIASPVVVIEDDGDTGLQEGPPVFEEAYETPAEGSGPSVLPAFDTQDQNAVGVQLPVGALIAGAVGLLVVGIGIGFLLFGAP